MFFFLFFLLRHTTAPRVSLFFPEVAASTQSSSRTERSITRAPPHTHAAPDEMRRWCHGSGARTSELTLLGLLPDDHKVDRRVAGKNNVSVMTNFRDERGGRASRLQLLSGKFWYSGAHEVRFLALDRTGADERVSRVIGEIYKYHSTHFQSFQFFQFLSLFGFFFFQLAISCRWSSQYESNYEVASSCFGTKRLTRQRSAARFLFG